MRSGLKEQLEFALKKAAQAGPRPWPKLKAELVSVGFDPHTLEDNHKEITDIFLVCLASRGQDSSPYNPETTSLSRSPPLPRPPSPIDSSSATVRSPRSFFTTTSSNSELTPSPARPPEEGWFWVREKTREKANVRFCFGLKFENTIGTHIIDRYGKHLRPRIKDDIIELVCCLDSQPGRTYVIKFQIEDSETFDVLLGKYWKGDKPKEVQSDNGSTTTMNRESRGNSDLSSSRSGLPSNRNAPTESLNPFSSQDPPVSPEFLARFVKELGYTPMPGNFRSKPVPRRRQDKRAGLDTDPEYGNPRTRKETRLKARASPWDSLAEESPRSTGDGLDAGRKISPAPKARVGRESDASMSQPSIFDTDDYQGDESEGSDLSSPDATSDAKEPSSSMFSPAFLAAIDDCWKVEPISQMDGYEYE